MAVNYRELIYLEGGPQWKNDCSGRGDFSLLRPVDKVIVYPGGAGPCEYVRTTRTWVSPWYGDIHTVFQFNGRK